MKKMGYTYVYIYIHIYICHKILLILKDKVRKMDGTRGHFDKWNKPETKTCHFSYMDVCVGEWWVEVGR
jgi:hypothetical protein